MNLKKFLKLGLGEKKIKKIEWNMTEDIGHASFIFGYGSIFDNNDFETLDVCDRCFVINFWNKLNEKDREKYDFKQMLKILKLKRSDLK